MVGDRLVHGVAPYLRELARGRHRVLSYARDVGLETWIKDPALDHPGHLLMVGGVENLLRPMAAADVEALSRRLASRNAFAATVLPLRLAPRTLRVQLVPVATAAWYAALAGRLYRGAMGSHATMSR